MVFVVIVGGLTGWFTCMLLLVEPFMMRPIAKALTRAQFQRHIFGGDSNLTWDIVNPSEVKRPGLVELLYWLVFWTLALALPLACGFAWLYLDWIAKRAPS